VQTLTLTDIATGCTECAVAGAEQMLLDDALVHGPARIGNRSARRDRYVTFGCRCFY
jgi:hypothetical protein